MFRKFCQGAVWERSSLVGSGQDALLDSVISASTLVAALIFIGTVLAQVPVKIPRLLRKRE